MTSICILVQVATVYFICRKDTSLSAPVQIYADPEDLVKNPQLPPRKYEENEKGSSLAQGTGEVCVVMQSTYL